MKYSITILLNLILSLAAVLDAQEIEGEWSTFQYTDSGKVEVIYDLKTEGDNLVGKVTTNEIEYKIENGYVNGNTISFKITYGDIDVYHTGYLLRDQLLISTRYQGNTASFTLNRSTK
ncbi:MAG: hypothetical protein JJ895_07740 [Balneolaceae bacterium]|nr:hypothetical protein [Balneolaceae bacterium]